MQRQAPARDSYLFRFDPEAVVYTQIGQVICPEGLIHLMAIDRQGTAWVGMADGSLNQVSTEDASSNEANILTTVGCTAGKWPKRCKPAPR